MQGEWRALRTEVWESLQGRGRIGNPGVDELPLGILQNPAWELSLLAGETETGRRQGIRERMSWESEEGEEVGRQGASGGDSELSLGIHSGPKVSPARGQGWEAEGRRRSREGMSDGLDSVHLHNIPASDLHSTQVLFSHLCYFPGRHECPGSVEHLEQKERNVLLQHDEVS